MNNYRELEVWKVSMEVSELIYKLSSIFPESERFGLTNQIRRCSISIPSNIGEGAGRNSQKEFKNFLGIAKGSLNELEIQLELSVRPGFCEKKENQELFDSITRLQKMMYNLIKTIN